MKNVADIRQNYTKGELHENAIAKNPFEQFSIWWQQALEKVEHEVNAFTLATVNEKQQPQARIVLLKKITEHGFCFYTNYDSNKGNQLAANPNCTALFFWKELERQIRVVGMVQKLTEAESDEYFFSRPLGSQIGAWASPQSQPIANRQVLEEKEKQYTEQFAKQKITRPPHWGGYIIIPSYFEFWQGRSSRLHDRIIYQLENNEWIINRLAP
jgi:pyridoxamine 5'-phosphate oxidase